MFFFKWYCNLSLFDCSEPQTCCCILFNQKDTSRVEVPAPSGSLWNCRLGLGVWGEFKIDSLDPLLAKHRHTHNRIYTHTNTQFFISSYRFFKMLLRIFFDAATELWLRLFVIHHGLFVFLFFCRLLKSFSQALASHLDVFQQILNRRSGAQCDLRPNKLKSFQCIKISEKCFSGEKNNVWLT